MVLFGANGTNSSKLRKGDDFATYFTLLEPVPMFSTRLSEFYLSAVFFLHYKNTFHTQMYVMNVNNFFSYLPEETEKRKVLLILVVVD